MGITQPTRTTPGNNSALAGLFQIFYHSTLTTLYFVTYDSPDRHIQYQVFTTLSVLITSLPITTTPSLVYSLPTVCKQVGYRHVRYKYNTATITTVPTIRATKGDILLPPETYSPIPTITTPDPQPSYIKHL